MKENDIINEEELLLHEEEENKPLTETDKLIINLTIKHLKDMIAENKKKIKEKNDVEGRKRLISFLEQQIHDEEAKLQEEA